jgi:hypothetical protein
LRVMVWKGDRYKVNKMVVIRNKEYLCRSF